MPCETSSNIKISHSYALTSRIIAGIRWNQRFEICYPEEDEKPKVRKIPSFRSMQKMRKERFFFLLSPIQSEDETRKLLFVHSRCHCTLCRAYLFIFAKSFLGLHPLWKIVLKCGKCIARNSAWSDLQFGNELLHFLLTVKFVKPFSQGMTRISKKNECDIWRHFPLG